MIKAQGVKYTDDEGTYISWWLLPANVSDSDISEACDISFRSDYGGPGRRFWDSPRIKRGKYRTLVTVRSGLDI